MEEFKRIFEAYWADYKTTMERFLGNETMYLRFLNMLFQDENLDKLCGALDTRDIISAFEAAHTLKGAVGNMGLTPLYESVCAIVEPLRTGVWRDDYPMLCEAIQREFRKVEMLRENLKVGGTA